MQDGVHQPLELETQVDVGSIQSIHANALRCTKYHPCRTAPNGSRIVRVLLILV